MAKGEKRVKMTLACETCKRRNYITMKNKQNDRERMEVKKYCRWDRTHTTTPGDSLTDDEQPSEAGSPEYHAESESGSNLSNPAAVIPAVIPADEARLVAAAKAGDVAAFTALVTDTQAEVYTLAYRLTGNEDDARDVAQEATSGRSGG